jgi:hypothetical protein
MNNAGAENEDDKLRCGVLTLVACGIGKSVTKAVSQLLERLPKEKKATMQRWPTGLERPWSN